MPTTEKILAELEIERDRLTQAIDALTKSTGTRKVRGARRGRRLSAAARRRISLGMKRRWAKRKKRA